MSAHQSLPDVTLSVKVVLGLIVSGTLNVFVDDEKLVVCWIEPVVSEGFVVVVVEVETGCFVTSALGWFVVSRTGFCKLIKWLTFLLVEQHEPKIYPSTQMPRCVPFNLAQSWMNMQMPCFEYILQGNGRILFGCEPATSTQWRVIMLTFTWILNKMLCDNNAKNAYYIPALLITGPEITVSNVIQSTKIQNM